MKKILLISHEYPPQVGGAGIVAKELVENLKSRGYSVDLITSMGLLKRCWPFLLVNKFWLLFFYFKYRSIEFDKYNKIIVNDIGAALSVALFVNKSIFKKIILMFHGGEPDLIYNKPQYLFRLKYVRNLYSNLLDHIEKIISVSNYLKSKALKINQINNNKSKVSVWYVGVDNTMFFPEPIDIRKQLKINNESILLLSVGRIVKGKGFNNKYEIFKNLILKHNLNYHWIIVGEGSYKENIISLSIRDGIQDKIKFLGAIEHNKLRTIYSSCDVFWLLSNFEESFGLVYLEAQACGITVIGRNRAGVKEAIENEITGFLVNTDDECSKILINRSYTSIDKEIILKKINHFKMNETISNFVNNYLIN
jgi:L-malate glycosyltransferase